MATNRHSRKSRPSPSAEPDLEPIPEVVSVLSRMLVEARAGNVKAVAVAYVTAGAPYIGSAQASRPGDTMSVHLLTAAMQHRDHEFMHALRGR